MDQLIFILSGFAPNSSQISQNGSLADSFDFCDYSLTFMLFNLSKTVLQTICKPI